MKKKYINETEEGKNNMYVLRLLLMALLFDNEINKFCSVVNYNRIVDENVVLR